MASVFETLKNKNESPILFVGSGITKRYIESAPSWEDLLLSIWLKLGLDRDDFYGKLYELSLSGVANPYVQMGSYLDEMVKSHFLSNTLEIAGLTKEQAYKNKISPLKVLVSNFINDLPKPTCCPELQNFKKALEHSRSIFTTNYDTLLESLLDNKLKTYFRQSDLFMAATGFGEIYKIHGSACDPDSIIITDNDYQCFEDNSALISAKLISVLMESPIIFLGYSLSDNNIIKIFQSFTKALMPYQASSVSDRIIFVAHKKNETNLVENVEMHDSLGVAVTVIRTDNFMEIFKRIQEIQPGLPSSSVRTYMTFIRKLIISSGRKGALKTTLVSPVELEQMSPGEDRLVLAIGNEKYIYRIPTRLDLFRSYSGLSDEIPPELALRFIATTSSKTYLPLFCYLNQVVLEEMNILESIKDKIHDRVCNVRNYNNLKDSIPQTYQKRFDNLNSILALDEPDSKKADYITFNLSKFDLNDALEAIKKLLNRHTTLTQIGTQIGRLIAAHDYLVNYHVEK